MCPLTSSYCFLDWIVYFLIYHAADMPLNTVQVHFEKPSVMLHNNIRFIEISLGS